MDEIHRAKEPKFSANEPIEGPPLVYDLDVEMACPPAELQRPPMVLLIDDDDDLLEALKIYLEGNGFDVMTANRGADAVDLCLRFDFDALICDMAMPRMSGEMFYLAISRVKPHLCKRFVFYTGYSGDPATAKFLASTRQPVLPKPMGIDRLLGTIDSLDPMLKARRHARPGAENETKAAADRIRG